MDYYNSKKMFPVNKIRVIHNTIISAYICPSEYKFQYEAYQPACHFKGIKYNSLS